MTPLKTLTFAAALIVAFGNNLSAQAPPPAPTANRAAAPDRDNSAGASVPLQVQVVIARYQGEKKVSSAPYVLSVDANDGVLSPNGQYHPFKASSLRMGAEVPVPVGAFGMPTPDGAKAGPAGPVTYKPVGTNIDCYARSVEDGRFLVNLAIEDSSVYADGQTAQGAPRMNDIPAFRSFRVNNSVILKDGQTRQFTAATDKISGDVIKIDVSLTIVK
jgi:hypothetical protein